MSENFTNYSPLEPMIKKDSLVTFSCGSYEDYTVSGVYLSNVSFNMEEVAKTFWHQFAEKEYAENPKNFLVWGIDVANDFLPWLEEQGYISKVKEKRVYLGDDYFFDSYAWEKDFKKKKEFLNK